jgi:hypothetical protein
VWRRGYSHIQHDDALLTSSLNDGKTGGRMCRLGFLAGMAALFWSNTAVPAAEGSPGPVVGSDIRSAQLPPPGLYGGLGLIYGEGHDFFDGSGRLVQALHALHLQRTWALPFLLYVPDVRLFGGSIGIAGTVPAGTECGRLFTTTPERCIAGIGDAYAEVAWSRFFGTVRPSRYPGAYPIAEGLTIALGFAVVIPTGGFDARQFAGQGLNMGNNVWDFVPTAAATYTTEPILADGTEISAKVYWNNFTTNPETDFQTGAIVRTDFAVSEKIGRWQIGLAGRYSVQVADDRQFGIRVAPDGRRQEVFSLGPVVAYDLPEHSSSIKLKGLATVRVRNTARSHDVSASWIKKF